MSRNLVVARVGENSLHRAWLQNATPNFDTVLLFYGKNIPQAWEEDGLETHHIPGSKWEGITVYLNNTTNWRSYDRVVFPDDDLLFDAWSLNKFFDLSERLGADLSQPALDSQSFYSHSITLKSPSFIARFTNFVEIMCPCLSRRFLEIAKPLMAESKSGWGLDFYWPQLLERLQMVPPVIIDEVAITHTRPVGIVGNGCDADHSPMQDLRNLQQKYQFPILPKQVVAAVAGEQLLSIVEHKLALKLKLIEDALQIANLSPEGKYHAISEIMAD
jgi:hypothetical protein